MDKKAAAKALFDAGFLQREIAETLKISERTASQWAVDGKWREYRTQRESTFSTLRDRTAKLNDYQLEVLERIVMHRREKLADRDLDEAGLQKLLIGRGDIDALQKMFVVFKDREFGFDKMVVVVRRLMEHAEYAAPALAKELLPHAQDFIEKERRQA